MADLQDRIAHSGPDPHALGDLDSDRLVRRGRRQRRVAQAAVAVALVALVGTGAVMVRDPGSSTAPPIVGEVDDDRSQPPSTSPLLVATPPPDDGEVRGSLAARVGGVVEVDLDLGCIWLSDARGSRMPVVWPPGTTLESTDPVVIRLPDGQAVEPGDRVSGGGGGLPVEMADPALQPDSACVQTGEMVAFNIDGEIEVEPDVGLEVASTLLQRFSVPADASIELVAMDAEARTIAVIDTVEGTVHQYGAGDYAAPAQPFDGLTRPGSIFAWSDGTVHWYAGLAIPGNSGLPESFTPTTVRDGGDSLTVVAMPDGDHLWLVQPGDEFQPTLAEYLLTFRLEDRLGEFEVDGAWTPAGTTVDGLVLTDDDAQTMLLGTDGQVVATIEGVATSVGWDGALVRRPDGTLVVVDGTLGQPKRVEAPGPGDWVGAGGPNEATASPPLQTGTDQFLVGRTDGSTTRLIRVDAAGNTADLGGFAPGATATFTRGDAAWVAVVEGRDVTLVSSDGSQTLPLGSLVPEGHVVVGAG